MHHPSPQWLAKLMDYIHTWLNKWRMQGISPKAAGWYFTKEGELQRAGEGPPERLDTRRHRH
jgi:hypothetical protein